MTSAPTVQVEHLTRRFGTSTALDDVSFTVERGELFGVVGPDGAGKTTLLRMLAGVLRPTAGAMTIMGIDVVHDPEAAKHHLAYMSQRFGLYGDLTVLENLHFYADLYRVPKTARPARLERLFRFSNLGPFRDRLAAKLSGGMKQKLGLSCALIHQPPVLLLDEPTFGVDPISRRDLWLIIHEMVAEGTTVVVSTAYLDEAERFDRVALLHRGKLLAHAAPDTLRSQITGQVLAIRTDRLREAQATLRVVNGVHGATLFGDRLHLRVDPARIDPTTIRNTLVRQGHDVREVTQVEASLEDLFIERVSVGGTE